MISNINTVFGERLRRLRTEKNITQQKLAQHMQLTRSQISHYERGLGTPSADILIKLSQFFNVSINYLFGLDEPNNSSVNSVRQKTLKRLNSKLNEIQEILDELKGM